MCTAIKKITKLGTLGAITFGLTIGITAFFTELVTLSYLYSYIIALVSVTVINFILNTRIVFKVDSKFKKRVPRYLLAQAFFFGVNPQLVKLLTEGGMYYLYSTAVITIIAFFAKYVIFNYLVFNKYA